MVQKNVSFHLLHRYCDLLNLAQLCCKFFLFSIFQERSSVCCSF